MSDKDDKEIIALKIEHFNNDKDLEFRIKSKKEMLYILQGIADEGARVCLHYNNEQNFILTTLLGVNEHGMWMDVGQLPPENKELLLSSKITFVSMHQQVKIQFAARNIETDLFENNEAFYLELPEYLLRILRREFFRIAIPADAPINCIIPILPKSSKERTIMREVPIVEISGDGIGLLCEENEDTLLPEKIFRDCQIAIPNIGTLRVTIVVRNGFNFTTPDNIVHKRIGCSFILLDQKMNNLLQRYIIRLQGESQRAKALSQEESEDDSPE